MASRKSIQEQFGQAVIEQLRAFARADIQPVDQLEAKVFDHVKDRELRRALARTMYGARWVYKIDLALVVDGDESVAHVRTQILDYASISESLLKYAIGHGVAGGHLTGRLWRTADWRGGGRSLDWTPPERAKTLKTRVFKWLIAVAREERMISSQLADRLDEVRDHRNTVHITELSSSRLDYVRDLAKSALSTATATTHATRQWMAEHP